MSRVWRIHFVRAERAFVDREAHELEPEAAPASLLEHVDVRKVRDGVAVGDDAGEARAGGRPAP